MNVKASDDHLSNTNLSLHHIQEFVLERFKDVQNSNQINELVKFHSINKYLFMSYRPKHLNNLGQIVANHTKLKNEEILNTYYNELIQLLSFTPTTKSHFNTLLHIFGHFSADLTAEEKRYFLTMADNFKKNMIPLSDVLQILKDCTSKYEKNYLSRQTYFLFFTSNEIF